MTQERFDPGTPRYGSNAEDPAQASRLAQTLAGAGATSPPDPRDISRLRAESPQLGGDVRTRQGRTLEEEQKKSNWRNAFAFIGGGTRWGSVSTPWKGAPSWVRLVNPIKTIWSTMEFFGEQVSPKIWEYLLIGADRTYGELIDRATGGRIAPLNKFHRDLDSQLQGTVHERRGSINKLKGFYDLIEQRSRPSEEGGREQLFSGEKFIGSLIADPLNLLGFGLLGKVPVVGRVALPVLKGIRLPKVGVRRPGVSFPKRDVSLRIGLGDFEDGYVKSIEAPFRWGAKLYRKIPKSRAQSAKQAGSRAAGLYHDAITAFTGKQIDQITAGEKDKFMARILDQTIPRSALNPDHGELALRDIIFTYKELTSTEFTRIIDKIDFADDALRDSAKTLGKSVAVRNIFEAATAGKLQLDEAAKKLIDEVGGIDNAASNEAIRETLKDAISAKFREVEKIFIGSNKSVSRVKASIAGIAFNQQADAVRKMAPWQPEAIGVGKFKLSVADLKNRQGVIAGIVSNSYRFSTYAVNNILYDKVGRPLAGMVLMFPAFSLQNAGEDMIRQLLGKTKVGKASIKEYEEVMVGFSDIPTDLLGDSLLGSDNIIRGVAQGAKEKLLLTDETSRFMKPILDKLPSGRIRNRVENTLSWLNPVAWRDKSSVWSRQFRRFYMMERSSQRIMDDLLEHEPELIKLIDQQLDNVDPERAERLKKGMLMRLHLGGDAIDKYAIDLANDTWDQEEMIGIISKYLNSDSETVFTDVTRASLEEWVANPNRTTRQLRQFMKGLKEEAYSEYIAGPEGIRISLQLAADSLKNISSKEDFYSASQTVFDLADQLLTKIDDIELTAGFRAAQPNTRANVRRAINAKASNEVDAALSHIRRSREEIVSIVRDAEKKWLADVEWTKSVSAMLDDQLKDMDDYVGDMHRIIRGRFEETRGKKWLQDDAWWREHYDIRSNGYKEFIRKRETANVTRLATQNELRRAMGLGDAAKIKAKVYKGRLDLKKIAYITGGVPDSVVDGMFHSAFMTEDQFADFVLRRADAAGHSGVTRDKVIAVYKQVMGSQNLRFARGDNFRKYERMLDNLGQELKGAAKIKVPDEESRIIREFGKSIADEIDGRLGVKHVTAKGEPMILRGAAAQSVAKSKTKLRHARQQKAISEAHEDLKQTFVNYADQNVIDDVMKTIFPFWKYETSRLPFLFRTSITHPVAWQTNHPDGKFWQGTDEGYVHPSDQPWNDTWGLNPIGGTLFNSTKRMVNAEYPSTEQTGVMGKYSEAESIMERFGFYPGPHVGLFTKYLIPGHIMEDREGEFGEVIPDLLQSPLQILQMMKIPGISEPVGRMRNSLFHDRFQQHMIAKHIIERGYNPKDVDFDSLRPLEGSSIPTQELDAAVEDAARAEWISAQLGMVRWRGDAEIEYRKARDEAIKTWTNLSQQELDELRRDGVSVLDVVPMPKPLKAAMFEINNADGFNAARALLEGGEQRRITDLKRKFYLSVDAQRTEATEQINKTFLNWQQGKTGGKLLRDIISEHRSKLATQKEVLTGRTWDASEGDYRVINPNADYAEVPLTHEDHLALRERLGSDVIGLRHPFDELLDDYYNIRPIDRDGDGVPEFDDFFDAQETFMNQVVPNEYTDLFIQHTERNMTEPEKALRELRRGDLGDYFSIARDAADELGLSSFIDEYYRTLYLGDDDRVADMRLNPLYRQWTRLVNRQKKDLRKRNPRVDYALRAFGYTTTWTNPTSRSWWQSDGGRFRLDRMYGSQQS